MTGASRTGQGMSGEDGAMYNEMARMAPSYDAYMQRMTQGREQVLRDLTVSLAQIQAGDDVLEVGCGTGTLTVAAKQKAGATGHVYGIDAIPEMIELSRRKAAAAGVDITFQQANISDMPFADSSFDAVLCSFMIFHMSDAVRRQGLREIRRVLKPGGRLLVLDLTPPANPVQRTIANLFFSGFMQHDVRELLPLLREASYGETSSGPADFRVFFLSLIAYVRAGAGKS